VPKKEIAGKIIEVDEEGYMTNMDEWNPEIAKELAKEIGIELTEKHFEVINYLRKLVKEGEALSIRKIGKSGVVSINETRTFYIFNPLSTHCNGKE